MLKEKTKHLMTTAEALPTKPKSIERLDNRSDNRQTNFFSITFRPDNFPLFQIEVLFSFEIKT
jgi:hypothetical protein